MSKMTAPVKGTKGLPAPTTAAAPIFGGIFQPRTDITVKRPPASAADPEPCTDCGGGGDAAMPASPDTAPASGPSSPVPLNTGFVGNQTDIKMSPPPLRDVLTQGTLAAGADGKDVVFTAPVEAPTAIGGGFHLSMAIVLLGVGLVALALWKLEA